MEKLTRWQAWTALVAGAYAALSPLWTETNETATYTVMPLGVLTVAIAAWSLVMAEERMADYALMLMGVLFIASPWVMAFDGLDDMALTAWIVGAVTMVAGVLGMPQVADRMHLHHGPIAH